MFRLRPFSVTLRICLCLINLSPCLPRFSAIQRVRITTAKSSQHLPFLLVEAVQRPMLCLGVLVEAVYHIHCLKVCVRLLIILNLLHASHVALITGAGDLFKSDI